MKPALIIVGLGNPGASYERTRHNAGWIALDRLAREFGVGDPSSPGGSAEAGWKDAPKFDAKTQEARVGVAPVLLVKPQTFMNLSGDAVRKIVTFYKLDPALQIIILCDEIDIPLGQIRLRMSGGPGTHNGLRSIAEVYGENWPRIRVGIGPKPEKGDLAAWVLSRFTEDEERILEEAIGKIPDMIREFVMTGTKAT
jgi:peptidyl-tRNA hydrolase, PTH1 family